MSPPNEGGPRKGRPEGLATTLDRGDSNPFDSHDAYMRRLADRIRWLSDHRHWWLRTPEGQSQLEFLRRDAA